MVFKKSKPSWNKGLTKETDSRIKGPVHTDESKRKISEAKIKYFSDPDNRELISQKTKESWCDAKIRNDRLTNGLNTRSTSEYRKRISIILKEVHARPDVRESDMNIVILRLKKNIRIVDHAGAAGFRISDDQNLSWSIL